MTTRNDAILVSGPQDGTLVESEDAGLLEDERDGLIHRYIRTTATRDRDGKTSPLAAGQATKLPTSGTTGS